MSVVQENEQKMNNRLVLFNIITMIWLNDLAMVVIILTLVAFGGVFFRHQHRKRTAGEAINHDSKMLMASDESGLRSQVYQNNFSYSLDKKYFLYL